MDAVEFYKSMKRMCYSGEMCEKCPLYNNFSEMGSVCDVLLHITDEKASRVKSIVEQWAKDHPVKTRQSEFLKMFPHAQKRDGIINICPQSVDKDHKINSECLKAACDECRNRFWNEEVSE